MEMEVISKLKSLEAIVSQYADLIEKRSGALAAEYSIQSSQDLQEAFDKIENENRLLQIGVVGRVKAGKSSLLNAFLFDGKSVLPKAATPMTAALTVISYGESLSAEVEFFSQNDIEDIKRDAQKYKDKFDLIIKKKIEDKKRREDKKRSNIEKIKNAVVVGKLDQQALEEKFKKSVTRDLDKSDPGLSAAYDQYNRIKKSGVDYKQLSASKEVSFDSIESLAGDLGEYVGSSGHYMPFTKSVHIKIPHLQERLRNIQIVDTPGVNDPVVSREERTKELLKFCDVVFVVSPAGQFMSTEDLDLMDRITSKEGVRELFVIASKCDMQLYGSVKEQSGGDLHKALESITGDLANSLHSTLASLKETNPEVGDAYDKLIDKSKESVIHSSGISLSIKEAYDKQEALDAGESHAWGMLLEHYPDYFSKQNKILTLKKLDLLSNMDVINGVVSDVREKKDEILSQRKNDLLQAKNNSLDQYKEKLLAFVESKLKDISDGDMDELNTDRRRMIDLKEEVSPQVDDGYGDLVYELKTNVTTSLKGALAGHFGEAKRRVDSQESSDSENYEKYVGRGGFLWLTKKYETRTRTFVTVRTSAVKDSLIDLTADIEFSIAAVSDGVVMDWKGKLIPKLLGIIREGGEYDGLLKTNKIRSAISEVMRCNTPEEISYSSVALPSGSGVLKKEEAEQFMEEAGDYMRSLKRRVNSDVAGYTKRLIADFEGLCMSEALFSEYEVELKKLEKEIKSKGVYLDRYGKLKNAIEGVN